VAGLGSVSACIKTINAELKGTNIEIKTIHPSGGARWHGIVNTQSDELAKLHANSLTTLYDTTRSRCGSRRLM
jgi:hypothetical protein